MRRADASFLLCACEESFPDAEDIDVPDNLQRPFRLSFEKVRDEPGKRPIERATAAMAWVIGVVVGSC